ncbi:hypothetical protein HPB49_008945 [Dermacentor silvarum]|uniref:Uncharacterized protein n=1 Tax=Dermacentor silvarum TaxID=543639 RepID=A0ACB8CE32_DERSI|nr:hypothetical protein HPB49_008945 [Dermacentor silvarum]
MLAGGGTSDRPREKEDRPISGGHETTGSATRNEQREEETGTLEEEIARRPQHQRPGAAKTELAGHLGVTRGPERRWREAPGRSLEPENQYVRRSAVAVALGWPSTSTTLYSDVWGWFYLQCKNEETKFYKEDATEVSPNQPTGVYNLPVLPGEVYGKTVSVLRDTGSNSLVVRRSLVPDDAMIGTKATLLLADGSTIEVPEAKVHISSPYFSGLAIVKCWRTPLYDVIVGNVTGSRDPTDPDPAWKPPSSASNLPGSKRTDCREKHNPVMVGAKVATEQRTTVLDLLQVSRPVFQTEQEQDAVVRGTSREKKKRLERSSKRSLGDGGAKIAGVEVGVVGVQTRTREPRQNQSNPGCPWRDPPSVELG